MDLIVFDLDGTLLNKSSKISAYTRETLRRLTARGIAYTVATGRALHGAVDILDDHGFLLPQIYKNGVMIWNPEIGSYSTSHVLTLDEIGHVADAFTERDVTPFFFTLEPGNRHAAYHPPLRQKAEYKLVKSFERERNLPVRPIAELPADADITNISAIGPDTAINAVAEMIQDEDQLVAYMGVAIEDRRLNWIDIHHHSGSKGGAVQSLKQELGFSRVICFGDSDNDLSMFETADEAYAPENAKDSIKAAATAVIGHHDADGIARFLRERFDL
ncbi:HAD family hydrolase [Congregibacter brevis]|uniref:HAD family hydrolase n=1 Tax=Congregibacter brevis TaxID=3081201 RepID=A0ABZ0I961_9GAMM|nr:HAD family hydrolase [Congregibacter sp. IMCC45268]